MTKDSALIPDLTGRILNDGQYKLVRKLGSGAFGVVYKAVNLQATVPSASSVALETDALIPEIVAIKVLPIAGKSETAVRRVRKEVVIHHVVSEHEGVVMLYDVFDDDDFVYMVLEYCAGGDLFGKITEHDSRTGKMMFWREDNLVKDVFTQIIDAVESCHQKRLYHRDLKPDNILCNKSGSKVYLSDFGLATSSPVSSLFGCGTSTYMSPECIGQETNMRPFSSEKSDIWSLGVILLNMVTSRSPWHKAIASDTIFRRFVRDASYLQEILPISNAAVELFRRVLAWDPRARPSLAQFRRAIHRLDTFWMTEEEIELATTSVKVAAAYCAGKPIVDEHGRKHRRVHKDSKDRRIEDWMAEHKDLAVHIHHEETSPHRESYHHHEVVERVPPPRHPVYRAPPPPQPALVPKEIFVPEPAAAPISAVRGGVSKWRCIKKIFSIRRTPSPSTSARTPSLSWHTDSPASSASVPRTPAQNAVVDDGAMNGVDAKLSALELDGKQRAKVLRVVNLTPPASIAISVNGA